MRVLKLLHQVINKGLIPVVTTEMVVTIGGLDFDNAFTNFKKRNVKGSTTKVEDQNGLFLVTLVQAVCKCRRSWLVNNAKNVKTCDLAGFLSCLTLRVVEVRRNRDHCISDGFAKVSLGIALELLQHARTDLLRGVALVIDIDSPVGAHVALDGSHGAINVGYGLTLGHFTDQDLAVLGECHDRRGSTCALGVGDDRGLATFQDRHTRVGGS